MSVVDLDVCGRSISCVECMDRLTAIRFPLLELEKPSVVWIGRIACFVRRRWRNLHL